MVSVVQIRRCCGSIGSFHSSHTRPSSTLLGHLAFPSVPSHPFPPPLPLPHANRHPGSFQNIERVWKAEHAAEEEAKKLEERKKELEKERQRDELVKMGQAAGVYGKGGRGPAPYTMGCLACI